MSVSTAPDPTSWTTSGPASVDLDDPRRGHEEAIAATIRRRRRRSRNEFVFVHLGQVVVVGTLLGLWELASSHGWLDQADFFYSKPSAVWAFLLENRGHLWTNAVVTLRAAFYGTGLGILIGGLLGLVLGQYRVVDRLFDPVMTVLAGLPRIALAPLFLLWFGITEQAKVFLAFSIVVFIMLFNTRAGVRSVDADLRNQATLFGANRRQVFLKVVLPGAIPVVFGGLRLAIAFGFLGVIASEMIAARQGLGILIVQYTQAMTPEGTFAVLAVLAALVSAMNTVVALAERRLTRWNDR